MNKTNEIITQMYFNDTNASVPEPTVGLKPNDMENFMREICSSPGKVKIPDSKKEKFCDLWKETNSGISNTSEMNDLFGLVESDADMTVVNSIAGGDEIKSISIEGDTSGLFESQADRISQWNEVVGEWSLDKLSQNLKKQPEL